MASPPTRHPRDRLPTWLTYPTILFSLLHISSVTFHCIFHPVAPRDSCWARQAVTATKRESDPGRRVGDSCTGLLAAFSPTPFGRQKRILHASSTTLPLLPMDSRINDRRRGESFGGRLELTQSVSLVPIKSPVLRPVLLPSPSHLRIRGYLLRTSSHLKRT